MYSVDVKLYSSCFSVPAKISDEMLKLVSGEQLKVILCILRNPEIDAKGIVGKTGIDIDTVFECIEYWSDAGIIKAENAEPTALTSEKDNAEMVQSVSAPKIVPMLKPTEKEIEETLQRSRSLRNLFNEAQEILKKTMGHSMQSVIYNIVYYYGLTPDVANLLLTFASYIGATSQSDILNLAKNWSENGINTAEKANDYIDEGTKAKKLFSELANLTDNADETPTFSQFDYLCKWVKWGFKAEAVAKSHEIMKEAKGTGRLNFRNFQYMDKILKNWHENGAHTLAEIEAVPEKDVKTKKPKQTKQTSFDIEKAKEKSRDRTRDIGTKKNKKRNRRA